MMNGSHSTATAVTTRWFYGLHDHEAIRIVLWERETKTTAFSSKPAPSYRSTTNVQITVPDMRNDGLLFTSITGGGLSSNFAATHVFTLSIYGMGILIWEKTCVIHMHGGAEVLTIFGGRQQWPHLGCGVQRFSENKGLAGVLSLAGS